MIESLSFTSDNSRIVVSKLTGRDARTPLKFYKADVGRTVSWLDAATGNQLGLIRQDFKRGNQGTASRLWRIGRTSVICDPLSDQVAVAEFGGGDIMLDVGGLRQRAMPLQHPALNIAYSKSGRFLAASGENELTVVDTWNDSIAIQPQVNDLPFLWATLTAFTNDEMWLVNVNDSGVTLWDIATGSSRPPLNQELEIWINAIAVTRDNNLIVCSDEWVRRYDFAGKVVATLAERPGFLCSVAQNAEELAVVCEDEVTIYDLRTNKEAHSWKFPGPTALALSSDGGTLAVGDYRGCVTLLDVGTGARRWQCSPSGRYRPLWTVPAAFLAAWICVAWRSSRREGIDKKMQSKTSGPE